MKIGINYFTSTRHGRSQAQSLEDWVNIGVRAEQLGFWSLWITEHHFGSDPAYRPYDVSSEIYPSTDYDLSVDPLTLLSFLAARTTTLRLGTAVVILHWDHPIRIAERAALVDVMSGGRLELGVGRGAGWREVEVFQVPKDDAESNRKFREAIDIIRKAWTGEPFQHEGEFWAFPPLTMLPNPGREAPVYIGSASAGSAVYAGEQGLPYVTITWPLTEIEIYRQKRSDYRAAGERAGHDVERFDIPHILFMHCAETDEQARDEAIHHLRQFQYINEQHYEFARHAPRTWLGTDTGVLGNIGELAQFPADHHIIGSPATCRERLEWFQNELEVTYVIGNSGFGCMPMELVSRSMDLLGEHVLPHFSDPILAA
jgi:alkanesulfonate monooxygenase SsuD/methylene tetrahydromethanopterin reductase-like flavin-dependent oxidoreductase (luciferase family)